MVREMRRALDAWAQDPAVTRIVVQGAGEKAFCAGGDIRQLTDDLKAGRREEALAFWREEYQLNIAHQALSRSRISPSSTASSWAAGSACPCTARYRVAGERYLFAMPEVGIGFFPDVGATYALPRLPGETGMYLALTGERVKRADAVMLGPGDPFGREREHPRPARGADGRRAGGRGSGPARGRSRPRAPGGRTGE